MTGTFDVATLARYHRCYFVLRDDHARKPGGDVDLARQLARMAAAGGATVSVAGVAELPEVSRPDDLFFLFNIDRPYEASAALDRLHPQARALLYTLHHPVAGVRQYLAHVGGGKRLLSLLAGGQPERYEALVDIAKAAKACNLRRLGVAVRRRRMISRLIKRCELLVTSPLELSELTDIYGSLSHAAWLLPHPVAAFVPGGTWPQASRYVLVPGRIEPRKNQLSALQTLSAMDLRGRGYQIVLVGDQGSDAAYFVKTLDYAKKSGVEYVSHMAKDRFFSTVSGAAVVVNASFFEVTSLIDLYAIDNAIPLVTTVHGYYPPGTMLRQVDPAEWGPEPGAGIRRAILELLHAA